MKIDLNILKRLGDRFGVWPVSNLPPEAKQLLTSKEHFIKAPAQFEPAITGGGYEWSDELNGYSLGNQQIYVLPNGICIWVFKDTLARLLKPSRVQKWTSGDSEYPMGKANAFFIVYGKLTGQELGQNDTAGDDVPAGEDPDDSGGVATEEDPEAEPFSKEDIQSMLKGEFGAAKAVEKPVAPSAPMAGPPKSREKAGQPLPPEVKAKAETAKIEQLIKKLTLGSPTYPADQIIDFWKKAKDLEATNPALAAKLMAAVKQLKPLEEGRITKPMMEILVKGVVKNIINEVRKARVKKKLKEQSGAAAAGGAPAAPGGMTTTDKVQPVTGPRAFRKKGAMEEGDEADAAREAELDALWNRALDRIAKGPPKAKKAKQPPKDRSGKIFVKGKEVKLDEMTTTGPSGPGNSQGTTGYSIPGAWVGEKGPGGSDAGVKGSESLGYTLTAIGKQDMKKHGDKMLQESFQDDSFRRAQAAYDRQLPPEGPGEVQCPECGGPGFYRYQSNRGSSRYEWEAECESCGNVWGDGPEPEDNLQAETAMGDLGPKFAAAQRAYDAQSPPEDPEGPECPECGGEISITDHGKRQGYWWVRGKCSKCGHKYEEDNF